MKVFFLLLAFSFLTSCASDRARVTKKQNCARDELVLDGVTKLNHSEDIHCRVPQNNLEICMVQRINDSIKPSREFNKYSGLRDFGLTAGYLAFILPGVALDYYFESRRDTVEAQSFELQKEAETYCKLAYKSEEDNRDPAAVQSKE